MYEKEEPIIQEETVNLEEVEQAEDVEEVDEVEDVEEESEVIENEIEEPEVLEEDVKEDESKGNDAILSRLDALEQRIGELMAQGGVDNSVLEDDTELSDIELENKKWYTRNSIMRNY